MLVTQNGPVHCWRTHGPAREGVACAFLPMSKWSLAKVGWYNGFPVQRNLAPFLGPVRLALASLLPPIHNQPRGIALTIESNLIRRCDSSSVGPAPVQRKAGTEEAGTRVLDATQRRLDGNSPV